MSGLLLYKRGQEVMKLYHFTSPIHVEGCIKEGINKGSIPLYKDGRYGLLPGWQWLTSNPDFNQQWANTEFSTLPYDRTAHRLTIVIPKTAKNRLHKWLDICGKLPIDQHLNAYGDPDNWYVFQGRIKPGWIRQVEQKEAQNGS